MYKIPPFPVSTAQDSDESDSSVDYEELAKYLDLLEPSCLRLTGSNKTYEQLVINSVYVPLYLSSKLDVADFQRDLKTLDESNRAKFFPKYCRQLHRSLSVLEPVTTELRKCLDPEEVELLDLLIDMLPEAINLACKDNGQIFFSECSSLKNLHGKIFSNLPNFPQWTIPTSAWINLLVT